MLHRSLGFHCVLLSALWLVACEAEAPSASADTQAHEKAAVQGPRARPIRPPRAATKWNGAQIDWWTYAEGSEVAKREGRPMLAVFKGDWCPHCSNYSRLFARPDIVALSQRFVMVLVDDKEDPAVSTQWAPDGKYVPRTLFFSPDGEHDATLQGRNSRFRYFLDEHGADELKALMQRAAGLYGS